MSGITITVNEDQFQQLQDKAERLQISLVELVLLGIEEILSRPDEEFRQAALPGFL